MTKLSPAVVAVALLIPATASADSELEPCVETRDCERDVKCWAVAYADVLAFPRKPKELRLDKAVVFEDASARVYSASRERLQRLAKQWAKQSQWQTITVEGYAPPMAGGMELAKRRAEKIKGYLVKYGVAADLIITVGRVDRSKGRIDLTIDLCDEAAGECPMGEMQVATK